MNVNIPKGKLPQALAALYNRARPQGMGFLHYTPEEMTVEQAAELLKTQDYFDYCKGRVMKVSMKGGDTFLGLYDRDNGAGAGEAALRDAGVLGPTR